MSWIYSLSDYQTIFNLSSEDLQKKILDYPGKISSINAQMYALGHHMISGDPDYHLSLNDMKKKTEDILKHQIKSYPNLDQEVIKNWEKSTQLFLSDYELGKKQGRYRVINLPSEASTGENFELLLCTDLLFNAHKNSLTAQALMNMLCQLSSEVRIFPLPDENKLIATELGPIMLAFQQRNFGVEVRAVNYSQRKDANALLRIWAKECEINE